MTVKVEFSESSLNLTQFVVEPGVSNVMVKMLTGIRVDDVDAQVNEETYKKARKRLKELSFVGIQEQYKESVQLFFHSLNKSGKLSRDVLINNDKVFFSSPKPYLNQ